MSIILQICIYLMIVLALMLVSITFFKNTNDYGETVLNKPSYVRKKDDGSKITLRLYTYNMSEEEKERIKNIISQAEFENIMDIVDDFKAIAK